MNNYINLFLLLVIFLLLFLLYREKRELKSKVRAISGTLEAFSRGETRQRVEMNREDEFGELAFYFNKMADEMAKTLREQHREKEEKETLLSQLPQGALVMDRQERVTFLNSAARNMLSIKETDYLRRPLVSLIRSAHLLDAVREKREGEEIGFGPEKTLQLHTIDLRGASGETLYLLQDISRYKHLEKMRRDFVSNVSHEMRTPLASIRSLLEALEKGAMEDKELREDFLHSAIKEVQRLDRLVQDLLDLAKIEETKGKVFRARISLRRLIEEVIQSLVPMAERAGLVIETDLQELELFANEDQMKQVLINLTENAIKYTPSGGKIRIAAFQEVQENIEETLPLYFTPGAKILVEDTGVGIPREHLHRIFERFYRVDSARSRALGGTGLGLSIVKNIVEGHGGTITMDSEVGKGTRVVISLPQEL